jgi:hypothetical protein
MIKFGEIMAATTIVRSSNALDADQFARQVVFD